MGFFSFLLGSAHKAGLSNSSTNMKDPLDYEGCLRLCFIYENYGGCHVCSPAKMYRFVGPGMVLYSVFRNKRGDEIKRGVIFYEYGDESVKKAKVFEWHGYGDGGCPGFSYRGELEFIDEDLYRTKEPFKDIADGKYVNVICELNWNTYTNEFAYREIYTPAE